MTDLFGESLGAKTSVRKFYGTVVGRGKPISRIGQGKEGVVTHAATDTHAVRVHLGEGWDGSAVFHVEIVPWGSTQAERVTVAIGAMPQAPKIAGLIESPEMQARLRDAPKAFDEKNDEE